MERKFGVPLENLGQNEVTRHNKKQDGVTFLEVMVVIAIITILAAASTPSLIHLVQKQSINSASRDILSTLQNARLRAVKECANVVIVFNSGNDSVKAFLDDGTGIGGNAKNNVQDGEERSITSVALNVGIENVNFSGNSYVAFDSRGLSGAGTITLRDGNGNQKMISLSATGNSRIL